MRVTKWLLLVGLASTLTLATGCGDDDDDGDDAGAVDTGPVRDDGGGDDDGGGGDGDGGEDGGVPDVGGDAGVTFAEFVIGLVNNPSETSSPVAYEVFQSLPDSEDPASFSSVDFD